MKETIYSINVNGRLLTTQRPLLMAILNATPDSFYDASRTGGDIAMRAKQMIADGADILDVGACSTRPGGEFASEKEELARLHAALDVLDKECPDAVVSIDTFRGAVVRECVQRHNVAIVNDVSGFDWDDAMLQAVVDANVPYVLTHSEGRAGEVLQRTNLLPDMLKVLSQKIFRLHQEGVKDVIVDPGFGFAKTPDENYAILAQLEEFAILEAPLLVGLSRKSMITNLLGCTAGEALNGTTVANTIALTKGAHILRVHDVEAAAQAIAIFTKIKNIPNI